MLGDDPHHILGRGQEFGQKKNDRLRHIFSSPLNMAPLDRHSHSQKDLKDYGIRCMLLDRAKAKVANSEYVWQEKDHLFDTLVALWKANPHSHKLLTNLLPTK